MAPHPLPSQPTLSSPQLIPKPQFTPRHPLLTPRPHQNSQPTLRHHHQPTHRILTNSNPRSTLSLSMTTTASLHWGTTSLPPYSGTLPPNSGTLPPYTGALPPYHPT